MCSQYKAEPTIIHYKGQGLEQTALHWACAKGHEKAVEFLIEKRANIEASNANQSRPLHAAAASGSIEVVSMLLQAGVTVTRQDGEGRNCEQIAESRGHTELAKLLQEKHHAVTDARDKAASAAQAAAYAAAAAARKDIIPILSPVEDVIAQGLVSLAIAGDIVAGSGDEDLLAAADQAAGMAALDQAAGEQKEAQEKGEDEDEAYMRKNQELEAQLGDVEKKLRLDRLYASRPPKTLPRVYF